MMGHASLTECFTKAGIAKIADERARTAEIRDTPAAGGYKVFSRKTSDFPFVNAHEAVVHSAKPVVYEDERHCLSISYLLKKEALSCIDTTRSAST